jgi:hypothetical protein
MDDRKLNTEEQPVKKTQHRKRFVWLDPLKISKSLLYKKDGRHFIGLILHVDFDDATKKFKVEQAMPAQMRKKGVKAPIVGEWHTLNKKWSKKPKPPP